MRLLSNIEKTQLMIFVVFSSYCEIGIPILRGTVVRKCAFPLKKSSSDSRLYCYAFACTACICFIPMCFFWGPSQLPIPWHFSLIVSVTFHKSFTNKHCCTTKFKSHQKKRKTKRIRWVKSVKHITLKSIHQTCGDHSTTTCGYICG